MPSHHANPEQQRLDEARSGSAYWKSWGPYLSERQWGTVREDYSEDGNAWAYFPHDQARSRAYRWGEDGIAGVSDDQQRLCFAVALWNGKDPILKERFFGLTNSQGNHGEDVKEYYFYLDSTPTHSWMRMLYKYPQAAFPYDALIDGNARRGRGEMEFELLDTGVFQDDRYFDVFVEYAKAAPDDLAIRIRLVNRGPDTATLHVLPTLWFRNTWSWTEGAPRPVLKSTPGGPTASVVSAAHDDLGVWQWICHEAPLLLFTENETNRKRIWGGENRSPYVKDGIHDRVVRDQVEAVNPAGIGTKVAAHYHLELAAGATRVIRLRLAAGASPKPEALTASEAEFDALFETREKEADAFFSALTPSGSDADRARVLRQALAGMLWSKQYYFYDVETWLRDRSEDPHATPERARTRNREWFHMVNADIISMPDKWEYPWYAAWDLAFHTVALAMVDSDFAHAQLDLMLRDHYLHPNGQIPAYEWNFGDVNPPVHAWAAFYVYTIDKRRHGNGDIEFLKHAFQKLLLNFTWWVNRKDASGRNVFEGGFLGLDNIGVFDRSSPLPTGGRLEQADGTAWMAFFSQSMLEISIELALHDPVYEDMAMKFFEHFLWIASAMDRPGDHRDEMWDESDGFFYDVLRLPDGKAQRIKVRSMVGLLPLCATTVVDVEAVRRMPRLLERARWFLNKHPELAATIASPSRPGPNGNLLFCLMDEKKLRRLLSKLFDPAEFLSPFGVRSLSKFHAEHPYRLPVGSAVYEVAYLPAESDSGMFGGNSNWRGPIWMPMNILLLRALHKLHLYYGDDFRVEFPTGSGRQLTLQQACRELAGRLTMMFVRDDQGRRPVFGGAEKFQEDPHWRDYLLFYEYFHGENGAGLGASHQTGWTGLVAPLIGFLGE
ncbi:MAG: glucosidase [Verrucomicrobiales bacterium]|nr:glucosidase [Verrucomicrobiales bacterium]